MKYAKINVIDELTGRIVSDTIVLPYQTAFLEATSLRMTFTMWGRISYVLEEVPEDRFNPVLFGMYMDLKNGKIDKDTYDEAVSQSRYSRLPPVNRRQQS